MKKNISDICYVLALFAFIYVGLYVCLFTGIYDLIVLDLNFQGVVVSVLKIIFFAPAGAVACLVFYLPAVLLDVDRVRKY